MEERDEGTGSAPETTAKKSDELSPRAVRFANGVLWTAAALFAINLLFAFQLHRHVAFKIADVIAVSGLLAVRLRAKPAQRLSLVLVLLPAMLAVGSFEIFQGRRRPRGGTAALRRGLPFDSRGLFEVVHEKQKHDPTVQSFVIPRALLTHNLNAPRWADEALAHTVRPDWGVPVGGVQTLPFGGVANRPTVFCNEGGYWAEFVADEHGFNNPKGIWGAPPLDVAIVGDSYSQGACVPQDKNTAAFVRQKYPKTLTLGMCANGPLMEYASLKEFVVELRPKVLLWVYYNNDLSDMDVEVQSDLLMRYVDDDGFRQDLAARQADVDAALDLYLNRLGETSPAWPQSLANVGIRRSSLPLSLQDVVMREQHSSWSGLMSLDWFATAITTRFLTPNYFEAPPRWELFRTVLAKAKSTVDGWGGKSYFVYLPDSFYLASHGKTEQPNRKGVLEAARAAGMQIIDVHEVFLQQPDPDGFRPHYEAHFTEEGFALVGKTIVDALAKDGL